MSFVVPGRKGATLFGCINGLRYLGLGSKVTRSIYKFPETYYVVTKVKLSTDQEHGKAWGVMVWRGIRKNKVERIGAAGKEEWSLLDTPDYSKLYGNKEEMEAKMEAILKTCGQGRIERTVPTVEDKLAAVGL